MSEVKLDKKDRRVIIIGLIIGSLAKIFIDKAIEIAMMLIIIYSIHKYLGNTKNSKEYLACEFKDEVRYHRGMKRFVLFIDIYILIRFLMISYIKYNRFNILELSLIMALSITYDEYLIRRYVKSIKGIKINESKPKIKNKALVLIVLIAFGNFTYAYYNNIKNKTEKFISIGKYEYKLSYDKYEKRVFEVKTSTSYLRAEETDKNSKYLDDYIEDSKKLINKKIIQDYSFKAMIFMLVLTSTQVGFKSKDINSKSIMAGVFLVMFVLFAMISFNESESTIELEHDLSMYFHKYLSSY